MELKLLTKKPEVGDIYSFTFQCSEPLSWQPGQYIDLRLDHRPADSRGTHRWFSIASAPCEQHIMITTHTGLGSSFKKALLGLKAGDTVTAGLPRGDFVIDDFSRQYVLVAGGIGITPFRAMLKQFPFQGSPFSGVLLHTHHKGLPLFEQDLADSKQRLPNFSICRFSQQRIPAARFEPHVKSSGTLFYISGPRPMVESYEQLLLELDVAPIRIRTDYFPGY